MRIEVEQNTRKATGALKDQIDILNFEMETLRIELQKIYRLKIMEIEKGHRLL